jgi:hypothetical protein
MSGVNYQKTKTRQSTIPEIAVNMYEIKRTCLLLLTKLCEAHLGRSNTG